MQPSCIILKPKTFKSVPVTHRFALLRGSSGFYSYSIYERPTDWPGFTLSQTRITFKLSKDSFHYIAVADNKHKLMPAPEDRMPDRCEPLAYPEAVRLTNPIEPSLRGEVDDKYEYATDNRDNRVQGWMSSNPMVGFWVITASDEFRNGGPLKQNLTSHVGPTCLSVSEAFSPNHAYGSWSLQ
jgi:rhamnogalacturonan endolyase